MQKNNIADLLSVEFEQSDVPTLLEEHAVVNCREASPLFILLLLLYGKSFACVQVAPLIGVFSPQPPIGDETWGRLTFGGTQRSMVS